MIDEEYIFLSFQCKIGKVIILIICWSKILRMGIRRSFNRCGHQFILIKNEFSLFWMLQIQSLIPCPDRVSKFNPDIHNMSFEKHA